jgi:hypothetical protein
MADTSFAALKREPLFEEELPSANPAVHLVKGARIKFAPGQPSGLHRHPVSPDGGEASWFEHVTDEDYAAAGDMRIMPRPGT